MDEKRFVNCYKCPQDGTLWAMTWSCMCDDRCPTCNREIIPYWSQELPADPAADSTTAETLA
jgi:hypothetical protein